MSYLSRVQYPGTGAIALYSIPFAYISKAYIEVRVGGVLLTEGPGFTWQTATSILLTAGNLGTGVTLDIRRATPSVTKLVDFNDGSVLTEASLDLANDQVFQLVQETKDDMEFRLGLDATGVFDAKGFRITNLADPIDAQDAVTKVWAETANTSQVAMASASASSAGVSATAAATSADASAASAVTAASYSTGVTGGDNTWTGTNAFSASPTVPTVAPGDNSTKAASTGFVAAVIVALTALINAVLPAQATNTGKYLKTDGTVASWQTVPTPSGSLLVSGYTQNTAKLLGRTTAAVGAPEEISVGTGLVMSAGALTNAGVTSVNTLTGPVTAAQIAAAATTGYGYTPANGASYVLKDFGGSGYPVGLALPCHTTITGNVGAGATCPGSSLAIERRIGGSTYWDTPAGTWRNISGGQAAGNGSDIGGFGTFQRIA